MVLLSAIRVFFLLSAFTLIVTYALPTTIIEHSSGIRRFVTHFKKVSKKTGPHPKETHREDDTTEDTSNNDPKSKPEGTTEIPSGAGQPKIRAGILKTCDQPNHFAVTFDDGPYQYTSELVDLLVSEGVKATFFVNGKNYWSESEIKPVMKKAFDAGNEIASHTFSHARISALSHDEIKEEMYNNENVIYGAIGKYPAVMRPPYGDATEKDAEFLNSLGYTVVTWSIDIQDWEGETTLQQEEATLAKDLRTPAEHNIILQHDVYEQTAVDFAPKLIAYVKSKNLEFVTVSECLGVDAYKENPIQL